MSTNFVYGSGNPLFKEPKKETKTKTETKAQIDARIVANTQKVVERLKPLQEKYGVDPATGGAIVPAGAGGAPSGVTGGSTLTDAQIRENERAYDREQAAAAEAEKKRRAGQSAFDILLAEFNRYGLGSLVEPLRSLIISGPSEAELTLALRQTPAYQNRFAANAARINKGLRALSEAEYIGLEDGYQNIMRNYGLPASYYAKDATGKQAGFEKFIGGDVSPAELEERVVTAQKRVLDAAPEVATALKQFYPGIKNGDILAYTLDPEKGLADIKKKVTAAEIGGAALGAQLGTNVGRAEELARYGVTADTARQGFGAIGGGLERGRQLADIYQEPDYTQAVAEEEVFNLPGQAQAGQKRRKIIGMEKATFGGQTGITSGALSRDRAGSY
jgi:hypothetical protein